MTRATVWIAMIGIVSGIIAATAPAFGSSASPQQDEDHRGSWGGVIRLPLPDGRINVGDIADALAGSVRIKLSRDVVTTLRELDWSINTKSLVGRTQLAALERITGGAVTLDVEGDDLVVGVGSGGAQLAGSLDAALSKLAEKLPFVTDGPPASFGITVATANDRRSELTNLDEVPARLVLLIHGLDDPGWMFDDLTPALHERGYAVGRFEYPNDGPLSDAADLLAASLREAAAAGVQRVDVVAHSMGGLIARDLLTRRAHYNGDGKWEGGLPAIDRLIMVGTPNHGSQFARFRMLLEIREVAVRAIRSGGVGAWGGDGNGEAGVDLLPDSRYLRQLNARPLARHTRHTIIAGRMSPLEAADVHRWSERIARAADSDDAPAWFRSFVTETVGERIPELFNSAAGVLGDGVVTIESTMLDGVEDFTIVEGNHMTMLYRPGDSQNPPPSIEIILDRLARPHPAAVDN